jgi:hypothetical protein
VDLASGACLGAKTGPSIVDKLDLVEDSMPGGQNSPPQWSGLCDTASASAAWPLVCRPAARLIMDVVWKLCPYLR